MGREILLLLMALGTVMNAAADAGDADDEPPDAELLEFLADWPAGDSGWLDAALATETTETTDTPSTMGNDHD